MVSAFPPEDKPGESGAPRFCGYCTFGIIAIKMALQHALGRHPEDPYSGLREPPTILRFTTPWWLKIAAGLLIMFLYRETWNLMVFWVGGLVLLIWTFLEVKPLMSEPQARLKQGAVHWLIGILSVLAIAAVVLHKGSDADDAFYLNLVVSTLDHPDLPLLSFDGMHGDTSLPILIPIYRISSYELMVATISQWTGIPGEYVYYLLFPPIFGILVIIAHWVALRELGGRFAPLGLMVTFMVFLTWGAAFPLTYGSFTFPQMFLAKSTVAAVWTPALIFLTARFARAPSLQGWVLLVLGQAAAVGVSSTSLVVAPLVVGMTLMASWRFNWPGIRIGFAGISSAFYTILLGLMVLLESQAVGSGELLQHGVYSGNTSKGLLFVLGEGPRYYIALLSLFASAIIPGSIEAWRLRAGLALASFIVVLNPWVPEFLTHHVAFVMFWRVFWAVPFPLFIGLALSALATLGPRFRRVPIGSVCALGILAVFCASGVPAVPLSKLGPPGLKVAPERKIAQAVVEATTPEDLVLAPEQIASWIPTFHHAPRLLVAREHYLVQWQRNIYSQEEVDKRYKLLQLVTGKEDVSGYVKEGVREIVARGITAIVAPHDLPWQQSMERHLNELGYIQHLVDGYSLWRKATQD